ncbi:GAF domain-containing protein [Streptomyces sp. PalvLS-984]|nr:GAF domain-containing protein [Streptomyces sp. PalvLS-984]
MAGGRPRGPMAHRRTPDGRYGVERKQPVDEDAEDGSSSQVPYMSLLNLPLSSDLDRIGEQMHALARAQRSLQGLLEAVLGISSDLELPTVLRRVVRTAMDLVGARYGALGVLDDSGEFLAEFIPLGLTSQELENLSGVELPRGRGLLGHLIRHPEPLRVADIGRHPESAGFPPGHPPMRTLLGVAISVRGRIYGNLYLSDRHDGKPFDLHDEGMIRALAGTAGVAIENARLFQQVRGSSEQFQRLLLPRLLEVAPLEACTFYRPASPPGHLGGDWYDAFKLPDGSCVAVIGDVVGHDLKAAAVMSRTRSMLRALSFDGQAAPSTALGRLDRIMLATGEHTLTTACVARIRPHEGGWEICWSNAGHPRPSCCCPAVRPAIWRPRPTSPSGCTRACPGPTTPVRCRRAAPWSSSPTDSWNAMTRRSSAVWTRSRRPPGGSPVSGRTGCAPHWPITVPVTAATTWPCSSCAFRSPAAVGDARLPPLHAKSPGRQLRTGAFRAYIECFCVPTEKAPHRGLTRITISGREPFCQPGKAQNCSGNRNSPTGSTTGSTCCAGSPSTASRTR